MKTISLKLNDNIFSETEQIVAQLKKSRNRYINEAVDHYNWLQKRNILHEKLKKESVLIREESMKVLKEFEDIH